MVTAANYPVALVSNGQNTRITTLQTTNMKGDPRTEPRDIPTQAPFDLAGPAFIT